MSGRFQQQTIFLVLVALLLAAPGAALAAQVVEETIDVSVMELEVSVRDTKDRPVHGLKRSDFTVSFAGTLLRIVDFESSHAGRLISGPSAESTSEPLDRQSRLTIFFDESGLDVGERTELARRLKRSIAEDLVPGVEVMIAGRSAARLVIHQEFTHDQIALVAAVDRAVTSAPRASLATDVEDLLREIERAVSAVEDAPQASAQARARVLVGRANAILGESAQRVSRSVDVLEHLIRLIAGFPGRKAVIYVGEGVALNPAYIIGSALRDAFSRFELSSDTRGVISGGAFGAGEVARLASRSAERSVLIYALDAGRHRISSAASSVDSSLDAGRSGGSAPMATWTPGFASRQRFELRGAIGELVEPTGGRVFDSRTDRPIEALLSDLSSYYSLVVEAPAEISKPGGQLVVAVANRKLSVRHRGASIPRSPDARDADRTLAALLDGAGPNPIGVTLETGVIRALDEAQDSVFVVPVIVRVPLARLSVAPRGRVHEGSLSIFVATSDALHRPSGVRRTVLPITLLNSELAAAATSQAEYRTDLRLPPGPVRLAVGVRDDLDPRLALLVLDLEVAPGATAARPGS